LTKAQTTRVLRENTTGREEEQTKEGKGPQRRGEGEDRE